MTISHDNHKIAKKQVRNDVHYTPPKLAKFAIGMVPIEYRKGVWLDCCRGSGNYYQQFPRACDREWCEISAGLDFFQYNSPVDVICSNPPYSILDDWLQHSVKLQPKAICYLIGINNITTKRMEAMQNAGYGLTKLHFCKVKEWFGMSVIALWERGKANVVSFDRVVWHIEPS